jgi:hypothetical protein
MHTKSKNHFRVVCRIEEPAHPGSEPGTELCTYGGRLLVS